MRDDSLSVAESGAAVSAFGSDNMDLKRFRKRRIALIFLCFVFFVLFCVALVGLFIKKPYVATMPGSAEDTESFLSIRGAERYPSEGEILITTVRVKQEPNLWEYLKIKHINESSTLTDIDEFYPTQQTEEENENLNVRMMLDSQILAKKVALEKLGYENTLVSNGVIIFDLTEGSAAENVLNRGEIVTSVDGLPTMNQQEFIETLAAYDPGDTVKLVVERIEDNQPVKVEVSVKLGTNPDNPTKPLLGVYPEDYLIFDMSDVPFDVEVDSGSIGGPSGGLSLTLAILDILTEGDLLGGKRIAFTGTIRVDGTVGAVGGVPQKAVAVRNSGVKYFIIPEGLPEEDMEAIEKFVGDDLEVIPVGSLDEALEAIDNLGGNVASLENPVSVS